MNRIWEGEEVFHKYGWEDETPPEVLLCVYRSPSGSIWFGTWGIGVFRFNPNTGLFKQFVHDPEDPFSLSSNVVLSIYEDEGGLMWIGTFDNGLNRLNPDTGVCVHERHDSEMEGSLEFDSVYCIYEERSGDLWLGLQNEGVNRFSRRESQFRRLGRDRVNPAQARSQSRSLLPRK